MDLSEGGRGGGEGRGGGKEEGRGGGEGEGGGGKRREGRGGEGGERGEGERGGKGGEGRGGRGGEGSEGGRGREGEEEGSNISASPVQLVPSEARLKPSLQLQVKEPTVFEQMCAQPPLSPGRHSSISDANGENQTS